MNDHESMTDEELEAARQDVEGERIATKDKARALSDEATRRADEKRLAEIAKTLTPEEAARVAELSQTLQAEGIESEEAMGEPGAKAEE